VAYQRTCKIDYALSIPTELSSRGRRGDILIKYRFGSKEKRGGDV